jgi:multisubunit Na+/H+ antiporter MnhG subunit
MWDEIANIKSTRKELREFGVVVGAVLIVLADVAMWRGRGIYIYLLTAGVLLTGFGVALPSVLVPFQKAWMALAVVMGFFMSRIILVALFYLVITPIGLLMRMLGKDILDQRLSKEKASYWHERPDAIKRKESYENQY